MRESELNISFQETLDNEQEWLNGKNWYGFFLKDLSKYHDSLKAFMDSFDNVKLIFFEDFIKNQNQYLLEICDFLNVTSNFKFEEPSFVNKTGVPRNSFLNQILLGKIPFRKQLKKLILLFTNEKKFHSKIMEMRDKNLKKPFLDPEIKKELQKEFTDDINALEKLLQKDLSFWKVL